MKRILLPTDFSENSIKGIEYAFNLYGTEDVEYLLVNAIEPPHGKASVFVSLIDRMVKMSKESCEKLESRIRAWDGAENINLSSFQIRDTLMSHIERVIIEYQIDLVVMGTTGNDDKGLNVMGSNTFQVVKTLNIPVYVVPKGCEIKKPKSIGLASDMSDLSETLIKKVTSFTNRFAAKLNIITIQNPADFVSETQVEKYSNVFSKLDPNFHKVEAGDDLSSDLNQFTNDNNIDLLMMIRQTHSLWDRLFNESATRKMTMQSNVPLLIFHQD